MIRTTLGVRQFLRLLLRIPAESCSKVTFANSQSGLLSNFNKSPSKFNYFRSLTTDISEQASECDEKDEKLGKQCLGKIEQRLLVEFTCKKCDTRNSKTMSKLAYTKGIVIIRCDGCQNNHLIADNLGWLGSHLHERNIEYLMKKKGETVKRLRPYGDPVLELVNKS